MHASDAKDLSAGLRINNRMTVILNLGALGEIHAGGPASLVNFGCWFLRVHLEKWHRAMEWRPAGAAERHPQGMPD
jgi:hypothetical protein